MGSFNSIINICIYECAKEYISMCTYLHMWATLPLYNSIHGTILYHLDSFTVLSYVFMHAHCFLGHVWRPVGKQGLPLAMGFLCYPAQFPWLGTRLCSVQPCLGFLCLYPTLRITDAFPCVGYTVASLCFGLRFFSVCWTRTAFFSLFFCVCVCGGSRKILGVSSVALYSVLLR